MIKTVITVAIICILIGYGFAVVGGIFDRSSVNCDSDDDGIIDADGREDRCDADKTNIDRTSLIPLGMGVASLAIVLYAMRNLN